MGIDASNGDDTDQARLCRGPGYAIYHEFPGDLYRTPKALKTRSRICSFRTSLLASQPTRLLTHSLTLSDRRRRHHALTPARPQYEYDGRISSDEEPEAEASDDEDEEPIPRTDFHPKSQSECASERPSTPARAFADVRSPHSHTILSASASCSTDITDRSAAAGPLPPSHHDRLHSRLPNQHQHQHHPNHRNSKRATEQTWLAWSVWYIEDPPAAYAFQVAFV
jgi:hypothetical protein